MTEIQEIDAWRDVVSKITEVGTSATEMSRPNIFRIAGFPRRETVSSNVLAYFFDSTEDHGLNDMMLKALLKCISKEDMDVSDTSVSTEVSTEKANRIDILLDLPDISIAIENKVDADLYNDLADYHSRAAQSGNPSIVVVLHPYNNVVLEGHPSAKGLDIGDNLFDVQYDELFHTVLGMLGEYSLDADPRAVDLLQQYIDNFSPERKRQKMDSERIVIEQFVTQANGVERQLFNAGKTYKEYTDTVFNKLHVIHDALIEQWREDSPIQDCPITLVDKWEYPTIKTQNKYFRNLYFCQTFELDNNNKARISFEFFINIEFYDGYVKSVPEYGAFNTIWYKAYRGGYGAKQVSSVRITDPYHQKIDVALTASNDVIKQAIQDAVEQVLKNL